MYPKFLGIGYTYEVKNKWSVAVFSKYIHQQNVSGGNPKALTSKAGYGTAAAWFITPSFQIKSSYELTNRMPEAQEIFGDVENQEGNPDLLPEQSQNINIGIACSLAIDEKNKIQFNSSGIYRHSSNFIYNRLNNNQSKLVADNRKGVRTTGVDGEVRYSHQRLLNAGASLTYQYLQNFQKIESGYNGVSPVYLDQMPNIPYLFGSGDVNLSLKNFLKKGNQLNIGYNVLYVHSFYLYWPSRGGDKLDIPMQLSHDFHVVYSLRDGRYNVAIEARNLTNALLYDNFSLQKPGRAFYVNFRYFFNKTNN